MTIKEHARRSQFFGDTSLFLSYARQLPTLARLPLIVPDKPKIVQIEVTNRCNLNCLMCIRERVDCSRGDLDFSLFRHIIDRDFPHRHSALLYGQGEPLLHPDIFRMIAYERQKNNFVTTVTNATLLERHICDEIVSSGLNILRLSMDASTPEVYNTIRKNADYTAVVENITRLVRIIDEYRAGPKLCLVFMVMENNLNDLPGMISLAGKLGISNVEVKEVPGYAVGGELSLSRAAVMSPRKVPEFNRILYATRKLANKLGIKVILPQLELFGNRKICLNPWFKTYITHSGRVTPCSRYFSELQFACGSLLEASLDTIWNNNNYREFRQALKCRVLAEKGFNECLYL